MFKKKKINISNNKGSVLLWTMMFSALFFLTVSTLAVLTISEIRQSTKIDSSTQAYLMAEAGAERAKNYAKGDDIEGKVTKDSSGVSAPIEGFIGGNSYKFWVVKATPGTTSDYDDPKRKCDNLTGSTDKYCYYSQATVGSIRRKIDGSKSDVPFDQGKPGLPAAAFIEGNRLDLTPPSRTAVPPTPTSPKKFWLRWTVKDIFDIPDKSQCSDERCFAFSLIEPGVGELLAEIEKSGINNPVFYLSGNDPATRASAERKTIPTGTTSLTFEMTYYVEGSTILKASNQDGKCIGVVARDDLSNQWGNVLRNTYQMSLLRDTSNAASSGPTPVNNGYGITLKSLTKEVTLTSIFFKVE